MVEETKIIRIVVDASRAVDGSAAATRALEKLERTTASMDGALKRIETGLSRISSMMQGSLVLVATAIGAKLGQMAKDALSAAGGLNELAEQLGITATGLQALQFSATQSGVKFEQLEAGIGKFSQKIGEAAGGSKEMLDALNGVGVKILDVNGKLRPTESLLQDVARGITAMADPARRAAAAVDFFGGSGTKLLPMLAELSGGLDKMSARARAAGAMIESGTIEKLDAMGNSAEAAGMKMKALFAMLATPFVLAGFEHVIAVLESTRREIEGIQKAWSWLTGSGAGVSDPGASLKAQLAELDRRGEGQSGAAAMIRRRLAAQSDQQAGVAADAVGVYVSDTVRFTGTAGVSNPGIKGAGQGEADRISKLGRDTARDVAAATAYAEASERGARAVADLEIHFKALKAAQDAYGATADRNTGQVSALTAKIEEQMKAAERLKSLKDFNLGTEELERSNQLLGVENALIDANVEDRARELALIKLKHDVQSKGLDENNAAEKAAIERRHTAIEQNERLKAQGEELRKANELWTAPLKSALESIQQTAADAFEGMLNSGKFSFQALGDVVKKTVIRMIAEFAALAIIRPMMGSMIGGLQGIGLVSSSTASSLGYGGGAGGSGISMPSMGGGGLGGFFNQPVSSSFGFGIDDEIANWATYGTAAQNSLGSAFGAMTWGDALGGIGAMGMGAYTMATSKGIGGMLGGGLGILGGGIGLASAAGLLPMLGAAGGPIGMALGLAGSILPMLFGGGEEYKWDPLAGGNVQFNPGAGGYSMNATQQLGGRSIAGQYGNVPGTIDALFKGTGGKVNPGMAFSGAVWNNQREGTTSTYIISPVDGSNQLSEGSGDQSAAVDRMIAKIFYNTMTTPGAVSGASPTLMTALYNKETTSVAQIQSLLGLVDAYDKLGKVTPSAETALKEINASFDALTAGAQEYGLSLKPIETEQAKLTKRYAQDFIDGMLDPLAVQMRALDDQRKDSIASAEYIRDNVKDVYVDMARIAEYWTKKELDLKEQAYAASVDSLQALVRRLTYGDLANASPDTSLSGTRGTYEATLAQARAGGTTARNNLAGFAEAYAGSARSYFASSAEYDSVVAQIRRDVLEVIGTTGAGTAAGGTAANSNALALQMSELISAMRASDQRATALQDQVAALTAQLQRR